MQARKFSSGKCRPMTLMLASVTNSAEADVALAGGADIIDLKDPAKGALGALDPLLAGAIVTHLAGRAQTSAVTGDLPMHPAVLVAAGEAMAATGVDFVKLGLFPGPETAACIAALAPLAQKAALVGVLFADLALDLDLVAHMAQAGFKGAMLDTARKGEGRLLDHIDMARLAGFVVLCRKHDLLVGLAGSLEAPDVPRLLAIAPDYLGFRGALCQGRARQAGLDAAAFAVIRHLIPQSGLVRPVEPKIDWRLLSARGYSVEADAKSVATDRIFVHDLVLPVQIGAYDYETGQTQNVRFNVDADVRRVAHDAHDMRHIVSYDVIRDAIAIILARGHIAMVETLADEIAQTVLKDARVVRVFVRVEKLDVIAGSVGVAIERERPRASAKVHELFPGLGVSGS